MSGTATETRGSDLLAAALLVATVGVSIAGWTVSPMLGIVLAVPVLVAMVCIAVRRPVLAVAAVPLLLVAGRIDLPLSLPLVRGLVLAVAVVVLIARWKGYGRQVGWSPLIAAMALLVAAALLSTLTGVDPAESLRHDVGYLIGLLLAVAVVVVTVDRSDLLLLAVSTCIGGALLSVTALVSAPALRVASKDASLIANRPVGIFGQPNELGLSAAMTLCFCVAMTVVVHRQRRTGLTVLCGVGAVAALLALVASLSRGAWIGGAVGLVVLAVLLREARIILISFATVATVGLALLVLAPPSQETPVAAQRLLSIFGGQGNPYDERPAAREEAVIQMSENPVLGTGPGAYQIATKQGLEHLTAAREEDHAHNLALAVGSEQGVLGVTALVVATGVGAREALRNSRVPSADTGRGEARTHLGVDLTTRGVSAGAAAALGSVIGHGAVDYPLRSSVIATMAWLFIGLLAACARTRGESATQEKRGGRQ
ncbi:O-antigen ligase family protein [Streptomyces sp. enrichment culture]|uniref:O-antigen ligase family protein n=1 Tax=Streptomyces sp. enrichment culture TaxID=1795815 RepID=UPI003F56BB79